jgi:lactoylglutathione lyase
MKRILVAIGFTVIAVGVSSVVAAQSSQAHLNHIAFYVLDLKVSTDFYMKIVGLDTIPEPFHDGPLL